MAETVRCVDCGYLELQRISDGEHVKADHNYRTKGTIPTAFVERRGDTPIYHPAPHCFRNALFFQDEMRDKDNHPCGFEVAKTKRSCDSYMTLIPGLTPREHLQKAIDKEEHEWREARLAGDRELAETRLRQDREYRDGKDARDRAHNEAVLKNAQRQTFIRWLGFAATILALVMSLIALLKPSPQSPAPTIIVQPPQVPAPSTQP